MFDKAKWPAVQASPDLGASEEKGGLTWKRFHMNEQPDFFEEAEKPSGLEEGAKHA